MPTVTMNVDLREAAGVALTTIDHAYYLVLHRVQSTFPGAKGVRAEVDDEDLAVIRFHVSQTELPIARLLRVVRSLGLGCVPVMLDSERGEMVGPKTRQWDRLDTIMFTTMEEAVAASNQALSEAFDVARSFGLITGQLHPVECQETFA